MIQYMFVYGPFYFNILADCDETAVLKAQRALYESSEGIHSHAKLHVELTAGAFDGNIFIEPEKLTIENIRGRTPVEEEEIVPF